MSLFPHLESFGYFLRLKSCPIRLLPLLCQYIKLQESQYTTVRQSIMATEVPSKRSRSASDATGRRLKRAADSCIHCEKEQELGAPGRTPARLLLWTEILKNRWQNGTLTARQEAKQKRKGPSWRRKHEGEGEEYTRIEEQAADVAASCQSSWDSPHGQAPHAAWKRVELGICCYQQTSSLSLVYLFVHASGAAYVPFMLACPLPLSLCVLYVCLFHWRAICFHCYLLPCLACSLFPM